uniref:Uncharacterized protein n=2 Tax=Pectinophora gossypiella TaxID=13191 RepID=A0A1E1WAS5_PECGO
MNINYKSFISLFNGSVFTPEITVPVISDVFTLQQPDEALDESDVPSTSKGIWYKPPDVHKRKVKKGLLEIDTSENEHEPALKKIKIVSPSKLFGSVTTDRSPINESPTMPTVMPLAFQQNDDPLCTNDPINIQPQLFKKYKEPVIQPRFVKKWRKKQTDNDPKINSPTKPKGLKTYKRKIQQSTQPDADTAVIFPKIGHIWGSAELPSKSNKCYEGHENSTPLTDTLTQQSEVIQLAFEPESGIDTVLVEIDDDDDDVSEAILGT